MPWIKPSDQLPQVGKKLWMVWGSLVTEGFRVKPAYFADWRMIDSTGEWVWVGEAPDYWWLETKPLHPYRMDIPCDDTLCYTELDGTVGVTPRECDICQSRRLQRKNRDAHIHQERYIADLMQCAQCGGLYFENESE